MAPEASESASGSFPKDLKKEGSKPVVAAAAPSVSTEKREGERTEGVRTEAERTEEARTEEKREAEGPGQPITTVSMAPVSPASRQGQWLLVSHTQLPKIPVRTSCYGPRNSPQLMSRYRHVLASHNLIGLQL